VLGLDLEGILIVPVVALRGISRVEPHAVYILANSPYIYWQTRRKAVYILAADLERLLVVSVVALRGICRVEVHQLVVDQSNIPNIRTQYHIYIYGILPIYVHKTIYMV